MIGADDSRILRTHVVPHVLPTALVYTTLLIPVERPARGRHHVPRSRDQPADAELGQPAVDVWGSVLNPTAYDEPAAQPVWLTLLPSLMIFITVFTFNQLGEGLREAFDAEARALMARFILLAS